MVTVPFPSDVIDHLTKIAAKLLSQDVQMYEKGTNACVLLRILILMGLMNVNFQTEMQLLSDVCVCVCACTLCCSVILARAQKKRSDVEWLSTVMASGTLADKMAARALLIQVGEREVWLQEGGGGVGGGWLTSSSYGDALTVHNSRG